MKPDRRVITAVIFGIVSIPWTYLFAGIFQNIPLWPSFIASASFFAAGGKARDFWKSVFGNTSGIIYAAITIILAALLPGNVLWLSILVGITMFLASMNYMSRILSFLPSAFFGYASMFSVHASGGELFGFAGLEGQAGATFLSMLIGALIALGVENMSIMISNELWRGR